MNLIWRLLERRLGSTRNNPEPPKAKLEEFLQQYDRKAILAELETFSHSKVWEALRAYLMNDLAAHQDAMLDFVGKSVAHCEAAEEAGKYKALKYVIEGALPLFMGYLKTGQIPGLVESDPDAAPEQKEEEEEYAT